MVTKKRVTRKRTKKISPPKTSLKSKTRKTTRSLIYSIGIFLISLVLYLATTNDVLESFFGFVMILAGSIALLFLVIEGILYLLRHAKK